MYKFITALISLFLLTTHSYALDITPIDGGHNLRIPVIKPVSGGFKGNCIPFEKVSFTYNLMPHFQNSKDPSNTSSITFAVRDSKRRETKNIITLQDGTSAIRLRVKTAAQGRVLVLEYVDNKKVRASAQAPSLPFTWKEAKLKWSNQ